MKLQFFPFGRWSAVYLDGDSQGFMDCFEGVTRLHLRKDAPAWLKEVHCTGPWESNTACQEAIKRAIPPAEFSLTG